MREYLLRLFGAVMLASFMAELIPSEKRIWVRLASGLFVACTVLSPMGKWLPEQLQFQELSLTENRYLMDEVERKLSEQISEEIMQKTGEKVATSVYTETDGEGKLIGIACVTLSPWSSAAAQVVEDFLAISKDKVVEE